MKTFQSLCIFGDSISYGAWDIEKGGWVNRLWMYSAEHDKNHHVNIQIYNLSIPGGTSEMILDRFESEADMRDGDALIFQTGGNDSAYENSPDNFLVSPEKFESNIETIIQKAKVITKNIIFIGFPDCDESKTSPVFWRNIYYKNKNINAYNKIMKKVCEKNNILFLDTFGLLNNNDFADGLHPNASGHEKLFKTVKDFLQTNKWI